MPAWRHIDRSAAARRGRVGLGSASNDITFHSSPRAHRARLAHTSAQCADTMPSIDAAISMPFSMPFHARALRMAALSPMPRRTMAWCRRPSSSAIGMPQESRRSHFRRRGRRLSRCATAARWFNAAARRTSRVKATAQMMIARFRRANMPACAYARLHDARARPGTRAAPRSSGFSARGQHHRRRP